MAVTGLLSFTLEVPDIGVGVAFYTSAGLVAVAKGDRAQLSCVGENYPCIELVMGRGAKRLHHLTFRGQASDFSAMSSRVIELGGALVEAPAGFSAEGLWLQDPHGMLVHVVEAPSPPPLKQAPTFTINAPGRVVRVRRSAILADKHYGPVAPQRLGHVMVFTPDVLRSVQFFEDALGFGLADRSQDVIAFMCCKKNSDHHVIAFAKSEATGFHHASFQVTDPDEVGRGGRALQAKAGRGDWGFGRHTIGSNFFHYIQDPWGSWFEYYSDMDFIDDYSLWSPTNYEAADSLASWAPPLPGDFVRNYEADAAGR